MTTDSSLLARVERIEAQLSIQQLPVRYALAVDSRDLDSLVQLFDEDVDCGRWGMGRAALKTFYGSEHILRSFYRSIHQICGHAIDFIDTDHAMGSVYCRAEHEDNGSWVVMAICYFDHYVRRDGQWYFERREEQHWYSTDWLTRPGAPRFQNWPGKYEGERYQPRLPHGFSTWAAFWGMSGQQTIDALTKAP